MAKIKVAVVGYGNVGQEACRCVLDAPDMELAGVVRRNPGSDRYPFPVVNDVAKLGPVDVAILTIPSRSVPEVAPHYLELGINTVDSYDIHGDSMIKLKSTLNSLAREMGKVSVIGAGWDPGTDSMVRCIFRAIAPRGVTYTNFGPGMSMGHTVAVKAIPGVKEALSMTLPAGFGHHRRDVYVELEPGADLAEVTRLIKEDPYFKNDETRVTAVPSVEEVTAMGHGVVLQRFGSSGTAQNQVLELRMRLSNPSATAQVMVAAARASTKLQPGAYTLVEIAPADLLPEDRETIIRTMV
ncbi:MAG TPA: diaminopimelate dehydrogenase [Firmicutes bacterium]|nr:diaminopimelate dehydrogenase [Candidatus Fermentithermobacillaceae bacterium]